MLHEQHEKSHSWKRIYECPKCPKIFGNSSNRDKHIRGIHEKIKPYKCIGKFFIYNIHICRNSEKNKHE